MRGVINVLWGTQGRGSQPIRYLQFGLALLALAAILAIAAWLVFRLRSFGGVFEGERLARMQQSKQFIKGRFENTPPYVSDFSLLGELKAYLGEQKREPGFEVPVIKMSADDLARPAAPGLRAWWLGHASVLIEIDGVRVLTDPVLSQRASPFQFIGPARLHPPPLVLAGWKHIDTVGCRCAGPRSIWRTTTWPSPSCVPLRQRPCMREQGVKGVHVVTPRVSDRVEFGVPSENTAQWVAG